MTLGLLRTVVEPEVVKVWPTGQVVTCNRKLANKLGASENTETYGGFNNISHIDSGLRSGGSGDRANLGHSGCVASDGQGGSGGDGVGAAANGEGCSCRAESGEGSDNLKHGSVLGSSSGSSRAVEEQSASSGAASVAASRVSAGVRGDGGAGWCA